MKPEDLCAKPMLRTAGRTWGEDVSKINRGYNQISVLAKPTLRERQLTQGGPWGWDAPGTGKADPSSPEDVQHVKTPWFQEESSDSPAEGRADALVRACATADAGGQAVRTRRAGHHSGHERG